MKPWRILKKDVKKVAEGEVELHMQVERNGVQRDKIVSGASYDAHNVGDEIMLPEHSGSSEEQVRALGDVLRRVLIKAGAIPKDLVVTGPQLLDAAEQYAGPK